MSFFFLFKQKTAYEMRISDWSSDVCSSDLRLRRVGAADGLRTGLGQPEVPNLALGDEVFHRAGHVLDRHVGIDAVLVEQVDDVGAQALERRLGNGADEIGRASCRERVCPYV